MLKAPGWRRRAPSRGASPEGTGPGPTARVQEDARAVVCRRVRHDVQRGQPCLAARRHKDEHLGAGWAGDAGGAGRSVSAHHGPNRRSRGAGWHQCGAYQPLPPTHSVRRLNSPSVRTAHRLDGRVRLDGGVGGLVHGGHAGAVKLAGVALRGARVGGQELGQTRRAQGREVGTATSRRAGGKSGARARRDDWGTPAQDASGPRPAMPGCEPGSPERAWMWHSRGTGRTLGLKLNSPCRRGKGAMRARHIDGHVLCHGTLVAGWGAALVGRGLGELRP